MKYALLALAAALPLTAATCETLAKLSLPDLTVSLAEIRQPGAFTSPYGGRPLANLPEFCRVAGTLKPTPDSDIRFEVWLPLAAAWNGKFQGIGNGGYAGTISFAGLADAVRNGYASVSTDTGHEDTRGNKAEWALHHPEKITDFGYRGIHETAVAAKAIVQAYYGDAPKHSYFSSCSNGGRQALMEAQRFPADYDGIVAGAPANNWTHLLSSAASGVRATMAEPASYIPPSKLPAIQSAVLRQCDKTDGVEDGVIEDPRACHFDTAVLQCKGPETDSCLTVPQLAALNTIYGGLRDSKGRQLMPGLSPGGEAEPGGWASWVTGKAPGQSEMFSYGTQFFQNMLYSDPAWDFHKYDPDRDTKAADDKLARYLNATDPDLSAFQNRGGKLILYHGWADAAIPALNTIDYFQSVQKKMGPRTAAFVRLYMVPGMQHCGGGAGPNLFGQSGVAKSDPQHDIDAAIEAWVEQGAAPASIVATKTDAQGATVRTRPLCPFPQTAKWKGSASTGDAANFSCVAP
jgi:feruloyl esterase